MNLSDLTKKRRNHLVSCQENEDNGREIIANLYSHKTHFIYELIQNADDATASSILFTLSEEKLSVEHNGSPFSYENVKAITATGSSTKPNELNAIGRFGAGFKSVFNVTESPHIHSGRFHFKIVDFFVPEEIESINCGKNTLIDLPFKINESQSIYSQVANALKNIKKESLLFLNNIQYIEWKIGSEFGNYLCLNEGNGELSTIVEEINGELEEYQYLVFNRQINLGGKELNLAIAYLMQNNQLAPIEKPIFVYFPTEVRLGFKFIIHVPYKTTPSRETIDFDDSENQELTWQLIELIVDSIFQIRDLGRIDVDFLNIMPICCNEILPYKYIFESVKNTFKDNSLLPTTQAELATPSDCVIADPQYLITLLDSQDINILFGKKYYITTEITKKGKTFSLFYYVKHNLGVESISVD
ncbi:MAG: sacsin N-terminal ATP-binding-like domain-containing protein, partial [Cyanobacteriota bacterium]